MKLISHLILLFALFFCYKTIAGTGEQFGLGAKNLALGNASALTDSDPFSIKDNPATISQIKKPIIASTLIHSSYSLVDTNKTPYSSSSGIIEDTYKASNANGQSSMGMSFILPLSPRVSLGVLGSLPAESLAQIHAFSGNEANYLKYDDRANKPEIYTALALDLPYGLSFGAGAYYSVKATGQLQLSVASTGADSRMLLDLAPEYIPYAGLLYTYDFSEQRFLKTGLSYRGGQKAQTSLDVDVSLESGGLGTIPFEANSSVAMYFDPAIYSMGVAYLSPEANGYFAVRYTKWSDYHSPIIHLSGDDIDDLTGSSYNVEKIKLDDAVSFHFGVQINDLWSIKDIPFSPRVGFEIQNSPLPNKLTSLAIVDSRASSLNAGIGTRFKELGDFFKYPVKLDFGVKWSILDDEILAMERDGQTYRAASGGNILTTFMGANVEF